MRLSGPISDFIFFCFCFFNGLVFPDKPGDCESGNKVKSGRNLFKKRKNAAEHTKSLSPK